MTDKKTDLNNLHIIVDGSSYLFRAYHALPPLTNSKGKATGAIFGVINMIQKLMKEHPHGYITVVFDAKGKTFRHDLYPDYKANRPGMPDDLRDQIEPLHDVIRSLGIPLVVVPGVEADDVIGTLAERDSADGRQTLISTTDKDLAQLVNEHVTLINTMNDSVLDVDGVTAKFGVKPAHIVDYLALIGDSSDNIPGVEKVGPKTAVKLLNEYGSLEGIIENSQAIKGKVGENLRAAVEQIPLSVELATIKNDVDLDFDPVHIDDLVSDPDALKSLYRELEFSTLLKSLEGSPDDSAAPHTKDVNYHVVFTMDELDSFIKRLLEYPYFSFDLETTSLDYMEAKIVGLSLCVEPDHAIYVPVAHDYDGAPDQLSLDEVLGRLRSILESTEVKKIGQNLKYDMSVLASYGVALRGIAHDTMLESYILNSTATRHDMDSLAMHYLGYKTVSFTDIAGKGKQQLTFNKIPLDIAGHYAAEDADITLKLHNTIHKKLLELPKATQSVYESIEMPLLSVLSRIELTGVLLDADLLTTLSEEMGAQIADVEEQAHIVAGRPFNLGSPKQIQEILFTDLALPVIKKTPKGQPSTAEDVLTELSHDYELPRLILEHRGLSKLKTTYTDKLPKLISERTGRVHTSYHQAVASTGRLSSTDPNLQNIPIKTDQGRKIRQAFIAPPGYKILAADYSQIELRIMAHLSGDETLISAFNQGLDIHRATAAEVMDIELDQVSDQDRRHAKAVNFGLIYGMSAFGLAKQLSISRPSAQRYIDRYFDRYARVREFMDNTIEGARERGYVETLLGRRLWLPDIRAKNQQVRQYAERTAINAPMQGTAADIIKMAMIAVDEWISSHVPDVKLTMQVHDELVFEIPEKDTDESIQAITERMQHVVQLSVPLMVDVGVGDNWNEAH